MVEATPELEEISLEALASRGRIVVCDDEPMQREVLSICLRSQGFEPLETGLGSECVRMAFKKRPQAILLDLDLPDASGLDICEQLADAPQTNEIPIIVLSGTDMPDVLVLRSTRKAGASFFLHKPYDPNAVLVLVERAIEESKTWDGPLD
ncbi:MAG: response regulator [Pirellulales bacterium]